MWASDHATSWHFVMPVRVPTHLSSADYWWTWPYWWLLGSQPRSSRKPCDAQSGILAILNLILWDHWNYIFYLFLGGPTRGLNWVLLICPPNNFRTHQDVFLYGSTGMGRTPNSTLRYSLCCPFWVAAHQHLIPVSFSMSVIRRRPPRKPVAKFWRLLHGALNHCEPWWR